MFDIDLETLDDLDLDKLFDLYRTQSTGLFVEDLELNIDVASRLIEGDFDLDLKKYKLF